MKIFKIVSIATALVLSSSANAHLVEKLGGLAFFDDEANLTWLTDADASTSLNWTDANNWVAGLTVGGVDGWRLPNSDDTCSGYSCTGSEMGNLFYNVLGNTDNSLSNTGPFRIVQTGKYWSAQEYAPNADYAWGFNMRAGYQFDGIKSNSTGAYAWAVQSGDVSAVPIPAAVWLFGSGLIGLIGMAKRKKI